MGQGNIAGTLFDDLYTYGEPMFTLPLHARQLLWK